MRSWKTQIWTICHWPRSFSWKIIQLLYPEGSWKLASREWSGESASFPLRCLHCLRTRCPPLETSHFLLTKPMAVYPIHHNKQRKQLKTLQDGRTCNGLHGRDSILLLHHLFHNLLFFLGDGPNKTLQQSLWHSSPGLVESVVADLTVLWIDVRGI